MDFDFSEDHHTLVNALEALVARHSDGLPMSGEYVLSGAQLEADLDAGGYYEVLQYGGQHGALDAVLAIEAVARCPRAAEIANRALIAPKLAPHLNLNRKSVAVGDAGAPIRFLRATGVAIVEIDGDVLAFDLSTCAVEPVDTPFAYPFGRMTRFDPNRAERLSASPDDLRQWRSVAIAAEIGSVAQAALDLTVDYVKTRRQFRRAIGSFQAIQHRLAECATMAQGARTLARLAAWSEDPADAMFAVAYAKEAAAKLHYETHQFHGAMGVTLDHPLHYWSYRLKYLQGEMGGAMWHASRAAQTPGPRGIGSEQFLSQTSVEGLGAHPDRGGDDVRGL